MENIDFKSYSDQLWQLLDNIDTLDDSCKSDDAAFRRSVRKLQKLRFDFADSDGYELTWKKVKPRDFTQMHYSLPISAKK